VVDSIGPGLGLRLGGSAVDRIWSPSSPTLNRGARRDGGIWIALPLDKLRLEALDPSVPSGRAPVQLTGCSVRNLSSTSQLPALARSNPHIRLAVDVLRGFRSTRRFITNGLNSSDAIWLGQPHCGL